jgi:hypothetical protein
LFVLAHNTPGTPDSPTYKYSASSKEQECKLTGSLFTHRESVDREMRFGVSMHICVHARIQNVLRVSS